MKLAKETLLMDNEFDELFKEWKKHFSKSRQRDYYFNARTNESVWTLDEVKESVRQELKSKHKNSSYNSLPTSSKLSNLPTTSKADSKQSRYFNFFPISTLSSQYPLALFTLF